MNDYQRGVYRAAELINLGWQAANHVCTGPNGEQQPIISQERTDDFADGTMCWDDVTGFVYEVRKRVSQIIPLGSPLRFGMERCFECIRQAKLDGTLFADETAAKIKRDVTDVTDECLKKRGGMMNNKLDYAVAVVWLIVAAFAPALVEWLIP